jgi:hypothetical protein
VSKLLKFVAALVVVMALALWSWVYLGRNHSITNGAAIFAAVSGVRDVLPKDATHVVAQSASASWIRGCSQIPSAHSGWTSDEVRISFKDADPHSAVVATVSRGLLRGDWQRHDAAPNRGEGKTPHWTLDVHSAHVAQAWLFRVDRKTNEWYLSASWKPPGPQGDGCP